MSETYIHLGDAPGATRCPICDGKPDLYERTDTRSSAKVVMCSTADVVDEEPCPLYLPPEAFYRATRREAIAYWNSFLAAAKSMRSFD